MDKIASSRRGKKERAVGIDLGVRNLVTLSNGIAVQPHPSIRRLRHNLNNLHRKLERQQPYSKRAKETQRLIDKTRQEILNCQIDYAQKLANSIVKRYKVICVEQADDESKDARVLLANWPVFHDALKRACDKAHRTYVPVKPHFTSQTCIRCGNVQRLPPDRRTYQCPACGLSVDRDVLAANNIKRIGLGKLNNR